MEDLNVSDEPLNPYSRAFFGVWALVALFLVGFQVDSPFVSKSIKSDYQAEQTKQPLPIKQVSFDASTESAFSVRSTGQNSDKPKAKLTL